MMLRRFFSKSKIFANSPPNGPLCVHSGPFWGVRGGIHKMLNMRWRCPWKSVIFTHFLMSDHKRLKKIKYREDLQLSEYVRSLFIAFVEAELLSVEVRVFESNFFCIFWMGARVFGVARMISLVNLKKRLFMQLLPAFRSEPLEPEGCLRSKHYNFFEKL